MKMFSFKLFCFLLLVTWNNNPLLAQKYLTKTGYAYFMSHTDAIDIDGKNNQVAAIIDAETGNIVVSILIKAFEFTLATADEHFNETYMESDLYPKASFKGLIPQLKTIDLSKDGSYDVIAEGDLTIHGQTKTIKQDGKLSVSAGKISIKCNLVVYIDDYKITVPKSVEDRVAQNVDVTIDLSLLPKAIN